MAHTAQARRRLGQLPKSLLSTQVRMMLAMVTPAKAMQACRNTDKMENKGKTHLGLGQEICEASSLPEQLGWGANLVNLPILQGMQI